MTHVVDGSLGRLIETEARLAEAGSRSRLADDLAVLTARVAADARCRRLHELPADVVDRLAAWVEGRLLAPGSENEPA
ncbi:MAG TPA: hypothetical protein VMN37_01930 [Gemmatimonadales bacterium]|nr:hypothetical protein [Gemmatimonadales bacterium]